LEKKTFWKKVLKEERFCFKRFS